MALPKTCTSCSGSARSNETFEKAREHRPGRFNGSRCPSTDLALVWAQEIALTTGSTSYADLATTEANDIGTSSSSAALDKAQRSSIKRWLAKLEPPTFRYTADMYRDGSPIG